MGGIELILDVGAPLTGGIRAERAGQSIGKLSTQNCNLFFAVTILRIFFLRYFILNFSPLLIAQTRYGCFFSFSAGSLTLGAFLGLALTRRKIMSEKGFLNQILNQ